MGSMLDYLEWRGDIALSYSVFNDVDSLILSSLSYVDFDGILPGPGQGEMSLGEAASAFFAAHTEEELAESRTLIAYAPYILKKVVGTVRFGDMRLRNYVNIVKEEENLQFSALEMVTDDGVSFVSYRGTDDTIVGWKEDFLISCETVLSDKYALDYLNLIHRDTTMPIRIGGHSKGGHIAIYAAATADRQVQDRIETVWSHDGPGFKREFLENEGLMRIVPRIRKFIPDTSVIGMLLEHPTEPHIIVSNAKGVMQHAPLSWEIVGTAFVPAPGLSDAGKVFDETFRNWIYSADEGERKAFIDDFFAVLEAPGYLTLTDYQNGGLKSIAASYVRIRKLDEATQERIRQLFRIFGDEVAEQLKESWAKVSLWDVFQNFRLRDLRDRPEGIEDSEGGQEALPGEAASEEASPEEGAAAGASEASGAVRTSDAE